MLRKKSSIVFLNQSSGYLMIDIVNNFKDKYDELTLLTGFLNPRSKHLDEKVRVIKIAQYNRNSFLKRFWTWFLAFLKSLYLIKIKFRKSFLFLVTNPPFSVFIPLFCKNKYSILVYDIYPDALIEYGYLRKSSFFTKTWGIVNGNVFRGAEKIFTISDGMKKKLAEYVSDDKIKVVPVWTDNEFLKPVSKKNNDFIKENKLIDKFIVMYSGNLGKTHPVEIIIDLAEQTRDEEIFFLIIGQGEKYGKIKNYLLESGLNNIRLLPWQPTEKLPYTLAAADIAVITLGAEASDLSIPSKAFNFMSVGVPLLGICNVNSTLSKLIKEYQLGDVFDQEQTNNILNYISTLKKDHELYKQLSNNSITASSYFTSKNADLFL